MAEAGQQDDATIANDTALWRRIPRKPSHLVFDENLQRWRPTSAAFQDHPNGTPMSVVIDAGQDPHTALEGYDQCALAGVAAGIMRQLGQAIARRPLQNDPHHGEVVGPKPPGVRSKMAKAATWVIELPLQQ